MLGRCRLGTESEIPKTMVFRGLYDVNHLNSFSAPSEMTQAKKQWDGRAKIMIACYIRVSTNSQNSDGKFFVRKR